jgi:hypothetical protein
MSQINLQTRTTRKRCTYEMGETGGHRISSSLILPTFTARVSHCFDDRQKRRLLPRERFKSCSVAPFSPVAIGTGSGNRRRARLCTRIRAERVLWRSVQTAACVNITIGNMPIWRVRPARGSDLRALTQMRASLWPDTGTEQHLRELDAIFTDSMIGTLPMVILVAETDNGELMGFLEVGLRSHADGCNPSRPVGFVEGWFV